MTPLPGAAVVDWSRATRVATSLVPAGPRLESGEARQVVADLHHQAAQAVALAEGASELRPGTPVPVLVVDRASWIRANVTLVARLVGPHLESVVGSSRGPAGAALGAQVGALLSVLATRVLGQYDPYGERLLIVAPNVVAVERQLGVDPRDFRLWVCVHEAIHAVQFSHAPWLRDHLGRLIGDLLAERPDPWSWMNAGGPAPRGLMDALLTPAQREGLGHVNAVMSLLEGHADFMMDRTHAIASVAEIRARFTARREAGGFEALLRALLGLDLKLAQYREGAAFCRRVVEASGVQGLNRAFDDAASLPTMDEIARPDAWLARV